MRNSVAAKSVVYLQNMTFDRRLDLTTLCPIKTGPLKSSQNSTNETSLFVRIFIMCNLVIVIRSVIVQFLFYSVNMRLSCVTNV